MSTQLLTLRHNLHAGASSRNPPWDKDSKISTYHITSAIEAYSDIGRLLYPHLDWEDKSSTMKEAFTPEEYKEAWEAAFGKLSDPATQERIAATVKECTNTPKDFIPETSYWHGYGRGLE